MNPCWCKFVLAVLVIVFAWWHVSWGQYALTVLGGLLAVLALVGSCCCGSKKECATPEPGAEQKSAR